MRVNLKDVKKGEFFRLKDTDTASVYVKGDYCRSDKKYYCYQYEDVNHESAFNGSRVVFTGFTY